MHAVAITMGIVSFPFWIIYGVIVVILRVFRRRSRVSIAGKHVIITGCDSGFGRDLVSPLLARGVHVHAGCLQSSGAAELRADSDKVYPNGTKQNEEHSGSKQSTLAGQPSPGKLFTYSLDVSKDASVRRFRTDVETDLDGNAVWGLVNNAGVSGSAFTPDKWLTIEDYEKVFSVNFWGALRVTKAIMPLMDLSKDGRIIFMESMCAHAVFPFAGPYSTSKAATHAYASVLRQELVSSCVKIISITPGFHKTPMTTPDAITGSFLAKFEALPAAEKAQYSPDFVQKRLQYIKKSTGTCWVNNRVSAVVDTYLLALEATQPALNYWVGYDANFMARILSLLPEEAQVFLFTLIRKHLGDSLH